MISHVDLYATPRVLYLVGSADGGASFRILTLDRIQSEDERLVSSQDRRIYTATEKAMYEEQTKQTASMWIKDETTQDETRTNK